VEVERAQAIVARIVRPLAQLAALGREREHLAPTPPTKHLVAGHLGEMRADRLAFVTRAARAHGDVVRLRFGWITGHLLAHPDHVRHVLVEQHRNYDKDTPGFEKLRGILGQGLLTSEGDLWRRQRRIAQPAFQKERIASFGPVMARAAEERVEAWLSSGKIDLGAEMMRLTLRIAGLTLLSTELSEEAGSVGEALSFLLRYVTDRIHSPLTELFPTADRKRFDAALARLDEVVEGTIDRRRSRADEAPNDLLDMMMRARDDETGETMSDRQLRDEVMTMFLAGHETTAIALTWALVLAAQHPAEARRVRDEIDEVAGARPLDVEASAALPRTKRFLSEALRLYPPAWIFGRRAKEADRIGGYGIPRDSMVFLSPWITHRHPAFFERPDEFDPDRFLPERVTPLQRHAYFPFGAGPRICIGQGFALLESALLFAAVMRRCELGLAPGVRIVPEPTITLRPKGAIHLTVRPRAR
jgi:cytochrome P450